MSELDSDKKKNDIQELNLDCTTKMSFDPAGVELTQKINVDYKEIINESKKKALISSIEKEEEQKTTASSLTGKSVFTRKRITDDYVKSSTMVSMIGEIPPLEDKLELQDIHNNYELKKQFASGAQGIIRTAFDKSLKRDIVVKSLKVDEVEEHARKDESLFVSEARIMAQLDHPSIIPLYGLHSGTENRLHLAMKHIHGKTLKQYLEDIVTLYENEGIKTFDEKSSTATRIEYLIKVCEAIDYSHCKGVIHRDLKPENIMIGNYGEVYVMDWGLACLEDVEKFSGDEIGEHSKSELVGTPCYIAPELIRGGECSPQSDIFALGMILFEIVTLKRAVSGKTVNEVLKNIINWNYNPFKHRFLKNKLPGDLKAIVAKAICDSHSHRYESANDMAKDLRLYLMREETTARPDNFLRRFTRTMINHKMTTSIIAMSILLALAGSTIYSLRSQNILIIEQEANEDMLSSFQAKVSQNASEMERIFFHLKSQLKNTAYSAGRVLNRKIYTTERIYKCQDFLKKDTAPEDYVYAPAYDAKISLNYSVIKLGKGTKLTDKLNKRVVGLQSRFKHVMFTSDPDFEYKTEASIKKIISNKGAPLIWIYMGLENGSMFSFPGKIYKQNYDPRKRPWYKSALKQKKHLIWSEPYLDTSGLNIVITCMQCVYDKNNGFLGVMAMDISFDYIQKYLFGKQLVPGGKEYLLDKQGRIIISSDFKKENAKSNKRATMVLEKFPFLKQLRKATGEGMAQFEVMSKGKKYIFGLNLLPSLGYYYIQQISEERLRKNWVEEELL